MPYEPITNLSRRGEKIAPFISVQNAVGMVALGGLAWLFATPFPGVVRFIVTILLTAVGYLITMDLRGMSLFDRMMWLLRGRARTVLRGRVISPDDLPGTVTQAVIPVTRRDGPVRLRLSPPDVAASSRNLSATGQRVARRLGRPQTAAPLARARAAALVPAPASPQSEPSIAPAELAPAPSAAPAMLAAEPAELGVELVEHAA